jgi:hypothetical protein
MGALDGLWRGTIGGGAVAELTGVVRSPAPDVVVGFDDAPLVPTGAEVGYVAAGKCEDGHCRRASNSTASSMMAANCVERSYEFNPYDRSSSASEHPTVGVATTLAVRDPKT